MTIIITEHGTIEPKQLLKTDGVTLKTVMCVDGVDWRQTHSNSCVN
jgi:DNA-directed RNA polymerase II subunit RPB1